MRKTLSSKKVFITGIEGFTGFHLKRTLLKSGYEVYGSSLKELKESGVYRADIRDKERMAEVLREVEPDFIIHLAGLSFTANDDIRELFEINCFATVNLLDAICEIGLKPKKVILASSAIVYGEQNSEVLEESMCPNPANPYANSKNAMENAAKRYFKKIPVIIARPFNYVGVGQKDDFVIPKIVKHFKEGKKEIELGNIDVKREFNDVRYVAQAYERLMNSPVSGEIVNICSQRGVSLREVIKTMEEIAGYEIKVKINPKFVRENEIKVLIGSTKKLYSLIEPPKNYSLKETLREIFEKDSDRLRVAS